MIVEDFTVRGTNRFNELQFFLEKHLSDASFRQTPHHQVNTNTYDVSLRYSLSGAIKLNELHTKWKIEDEKNVKKRTNKNFTHFFSQFFFSSS